MIINCSETSPNRIYKILISSVVPRPIAWVSTISNLDIPNLAPFSFFNAFCANPAILGFACGYKQGANGEMIPKDTLRNIRENNEFVVNIVSRRLVEKMNQTSGEYDAGISEFDAADIRAASSYMVRPARVADALINMECRLFQFVELGGSCLILGEIMCFHLDESVLPAIDGGIDLSVLDPIGRLGGELYTTVSDRFALARPKL